MAARKMIPPDVILRLAVEVDEEGKATGVRVHLLRPGTQQGEEVEYLPHSSRPEEALLVGLVSALEVARRYQPRSLRVELPSPRLAAILRREEEVPDPLLLPYMQVRSLLNALPWVEIVSSSLSAETALHR